MILHEHELAKRNDDGAENATDEDDYGVVNENDDDDEMVANSDEFAVMSIGM